MRTATPIKAAVRSAGWSSSTPVKSASATIGNARFANWFQIPVTATAKATVPPRKPQERNIEYDPAIPTAEPAGDTIESAVDACVNTSACR